MDKKEFEAWLEHSDFVNAEEQRKEIFRTMSDADMRAFLKKLKVTDHEIERRLQNREQLVEELNDLCHSLRLPIRSPS